MSDILLAETLEAARADRLNRARQQVRQCIVLAVVAAEPVRAELIDTAITLQAEASDD